MTAAGAAATFDIGRVISRLVSVLTRNIGVFALLSLLLAGVPAALTTLASLTLFQPIVGFDPSQPLRMAGTGLGAFVINAAAGAVLQGAVIFGAVSDLAGRRAGFRECLSAGARHFLPLIGVGLVSAVCEVFGLVLFIFPGVLVALAWCVAAPAVVMEDRGVFASLGRSGELTRDHRGSIFVLAILLWLAQLAISVVSNAASGIGSAATFGGLSVSTTGAPLMITGVAASLVTRTVVSGVAAAGVASVYYELRQIKEGVGAQQLAAIFD